MANRQNIPLKNALINLAAPLTAAAKNALDSMLRVDTSNLNDKTQGDNFRGAVKGHGNFWNTLGTTIVPTDDHHSQQFLWEKGDNNGYKWGPAVENNFATLRKHAAEKRITLALQDASADLLKAILEAPDDPSLRNILATHPDSQAVFGNITGTWTGWNSNNDNLLDAQALANIKAAASPHLPLAVERKVTAGLATANEQLLKDIVSAANDGEVRQKLLGPDGISAFGNLATYPGWNVNPAAILDANAATRIQAEAKRRLALTAENKVAQGLKTASEALLVEIIKAATPDEVRQQLITPEGKRLFGDFTTYPNWAINTPDVISVAAKDEIQKNAQRILLLHKIQACTNDQLIKNLLIAHDTPTFINAAKALGVPDDCANKMVFGAAHLKEARSQAFMAYAKKNLKNMDGTALNNLVVAVAIGTVIGGARVLLGGTAGVAHPIDDLFTDPNINAGIAKEFLDQAKLEKAYRDDKAQVLAHVNVQQLKDIAQAKDITEFKAKLTAAGIVHHNPPTDWITTATMQEMQNFARTRLNVLQTASISVFAQRPALAALIDQLPSDAQKGLFTNPGIVRSLADARSEEAIKLILGKAATGLNQPLLSNLVTENTQFALASEIANSKIAKIIGDLTVPPGVGMPPAPLLLTPDRVAAINDILTAAPQPDFSTPAGCQAALDSITNHVAFTTPPGVLALGALDNTFGLTGRGGALGFSGTSPQAAIDAQVQHNQDLIIKHNGNLGVLPVIPPASASDQVILRFLMGLEKHQVLPNNEIDALVQAFRAAPTAAEFIRNINPILVSDPYAGTVFSLKDLQQQITPEAYKAAKSGADRALLLDPNAPQAQLRAFVDRQQKERKDFVDLHEKIVAQDKKLHKDIELLSETKPFDWFNPVFQATAKQNANNMLPYYRELDKISSTMVKFYRNEKALLEAQLKSIPDPDTETIPANLAARSARFKFRRQEIQTRLDAANAELERYEKVQKILHGDPGAPDPLLKQGVLNMLEKAVKGGDITFTSHASTYSDHPASEKGRLLHDNVKDAVTISAVVAHTGTAERFQHFTALDKRSGLDILREPIPPGQIRNHTIAVPVDPTNPLSQVIESGYLEERGKDIVSSSKAKGTEISPNYALTIRDIPTVPQGATDAEKKACREARNIMYMEMAMRLIKELNAPPTKEKPIYVQGHNPVVLAGIWRALMVIGKNDPNMEFNSDAIQIPSLAFDKEKFVQKGRMWGETIIDPGFAGFEKNNAVQGCLASIKEYNEEKFGKEAQKQQKQVTANVDVVNTMKTKLGSIITEVNAKNKEAEDTTPTLDSGMKP